MMANYYRIIGLTIAVNLSLLSLAPAQQQPQPAEVEALAPVTGTYAFTNAFITQAPGRKIERGTMVIKDGLIVSVGRNISIPSDAIVIKDDSLFIYAGFIDGLSRTGVIKPKEDPAATRERPKDPGNPQPEVAGITPHHDVVYFLNAADKTVEDLRAIGFTATQVVPYGGMLPGSAAIVLLNGKTPDDMILESRSAFFSELVPAQRVYPNTVIGVMAKWRELYRQAVLSKNYESTYSTNRVGLQRPSTDRITAAFYPVIDKRMPVLFRTEKFLDAQRVLALRNELGFPLVLADLKEGWDLIPKLKAVNTSVFLSLDLPEEKKDVKKTEADKQQQAESKPDPEREALEKRKAESIQAYVSQARKFQDAGLIFGFSCYSVKTTDIHKNLRSVIASGLTEDQVLAALTVNPAQMLGVADRLGSIDAGKIANLVISDKPFFHEKAKIQYVFVDGVMYKYPKVSTTSSATAINIAGSWSVTSQTPEGPVEDKVTFQKDGTAYSGSLTGRRFSEAVSLEAIELTGQNLKYSYTIDAEGQTVRIDVEVTVEGNTFKGTSVAGRFGTFTVVGRKDPNK